MANALDGNSNLCKYLSQTLQPAFTSDLTCTEILLSSVSLALLKAYWILATIAVVVVLFNFPIPKLFKQVLHVSPLFNFNCSLFTHLIWVKS